MACSRHDNLPCSQSDPSRNDVWKVEGVSTFSLGVLVRGHGIHIMINNNSIETDARHNARPTNQSTPLS